MLRGTPEDTSEVGELTDEHERIVSTLAAARESMTRFGASASAEDGSPPCWPSVS